MAAWPESVVSTTLSGMAQAATAAVSAKCLCRGPSDRNLLSCCREDACHKVGLS